MVMGSAGQNTARGLQHGDSSTGERVLVDDKSSAAVVADGLLRHSNSLGVAPSLSRYLISAWFVIAAGVLFLAVFAKLQWIFSNPLWEDIAIGGVWLTLVSIVLELWTAAALLLLPSRRKAAWIGQMMHGVLLVASISFWVTGQSCQCFGDWQLGAWKISTWSLPVYNLGAVACFLWIAVKTNPQPVTTAWIKLPDIGTQVGVGLGLLLGLFMLSTSQGQQFWRTGAAANEVVLQIGELPDLVPGQSYESTVTLYNRLSKPIRVVGGGTSCTCVTLEDIPLEIPANSRRELAIRFKVGEHLRGQKEFTSSLVY